MREIKFRGFELDLKRWVYGGFHKHIKRQICPIDDDLKEEDIQYLIIMDEFADWNMPKGIKVATNIDKNSIGQFTGLKDKNSKRIYEGDIVKYVIGTFTSKGIVYFNSLVGSFEIEDLEDDEYTEILGLTDELIVIGNMYENKEFLEKEDD